MILATSFATPAASHVLLILGMFLAFAFAVGAALELRDEAEESFTGEELPTQMGGMTPTILPGIHHFRLPANIDQCWEARDYPKKDSQGEPLLKDGVAIMEQHLLLVFDKDNPLIVESDDEFNGLPATATISTLPRRRGKKGDDKAPMVADMAYLLRDSLADKSPVVKRADWMAAINKHAGEMIRLEHGLSAQCAADRVRYIPDGAGGSIEDPDGNVGCDHAAGPAGVYDEATQTVTYPGRAGSRLYTNDFKTKVYDEEKQKDVVVFADRAACKGCGAILRGFFRVERFLKPLASTQQG